MDVLMPQLGETVAEGRITTWFKAPGDSVSAGENLFEIETDKVTMEVQAVASGVLAEIRVADGDVVPVGTIVGILDEEGSEAGRRAGGGIVESAECQLPPHNNGFAPAPFAETNTPKGRYGTASVPGVRVTPLARRLAAENDLDLTVVAADVKATGATRIGRAEVEAALAARGSASPSARLKAHGPTDSFLRERVPFNAIRRRTAERLAESWRTIPHAYQAVEVDFSAVDAVRQARKAAFAERHGAALTYLPFVARAISIAIADFPHVNARLDGGGLIVLPAVNLGIAVDLAGQGLVVPVVKDAGGLTVTGLAKAIARLVERARSNALLPDDLAGGTYTISNNGAFGTLLTAPIINPPEVAILSMDTVSRKIVVVGDDDSAAIAIRPVGTLVQSFDHRAFDGAYSASFLRRVRSLIERHDWDAEVS